MVKWISKATWLFYIFFTTGISSHFCKYHVCLTWTVSEDVLNLKCRVNNLHFRVKIKDPSNKLIGECYPAQQNSNCDKYSKNVVIAQNITTNETTCLIRGTIDDRMNGKWKCLHGTNKGLADVDVTVLRYKENGDVKCRAMLLSVIGYFGAILLWLTLLSVSPIKPKCVEGLYKRVLCKKARIIPACKGVTFLVLTLLILIIFWKCSDSPDNTCKMQYVYFAIGLVCGLIMAIFFLNKEDEKEEDETHRDTPENDMNRGEIQEVETDRDTPEHDMNRDVVEDASSAQPPTDAGYLRLATDDVFAQPTTEASYHPLTTESIETEEIQVLD